MWQLKRWGRRNRIWRSYRVALLLLRTIYIINRERSRVVHARERGDYEVRPDLEALLSVLRDFRHTAIALGGLLIKLGQFLGARADLLPQEALAELAALQDEVPAERFQDIKCVLEREWKAPVGEVCAAIDPEPAGSASLGQVHRARLHDGRIVAVKVQRPGIGDIVRTDLRTLRFVLRIVGLVPAANRIVDLDALYREFSRTVYEELDYQQEARNAKHFAEIFADDPCILVPGVIPEYSTRHVLVLQWMDGIKITDFEALDAAGVDRLQLANRLTEAYLTQVLEASYFHADPHPGNLLVQPHRDGARIVFVDFGMMGTITPRMRDGLRNCFTGIMTQDAALVVRGLDALGFLTDAANRESIERVVAAMLAQYSKGGGVPMGRRSGADPSEVLGDVESTMYDQPFRLPAQFAFFGRMAGMLLGLTAALSPQYNFIEVASPHAQQFIGSNGVDGILRLLGIDSVDALGRDLLRGSVATARSLAALPSRVDRLLDRVERGELHVVVESAAAARVRRRRGRGAVTGLFNRPIPMWLPLGLLGVYGVTRLVWRRIPRDKIPV